MAKSKLVSKTPGEGEPQEGAEPEVAEDAAAEHIHDLTVPGGRYLVWRGGEQVLVNARGGEFSEDARENLMPTQEEMQAPAV